MGQRTDGSTNVSVANISRQQGRSTREGIQGSDTKGRIRREACLCVRNARGPRVGRDAWLDSEGVRKREEEDGRSSRKGSRTFKGQKTGPRAQRGEGSTDPTAGGQAPASGARHSPHDFSHGHGPVHVVGVAVLEKALGPGQSLHANQRIPVNGAC